MRNWGRAPRNKTVGATDGTGTEQIVQVKPRRVDHMWTTTSATAAKTAS